MTQPTASPPAAAQPEPDKLGVSLRVRARGALAIPFLAFVLAVVVGSILMLGSGFLTAHTFDPSLPFRAWAALLEGAGISADPDRAFNGLITTAVDAAPLVLGGLSVALAFKAGLFNIGAKGQFLMGALAAGGVGAAMADQPAPIAIVVSVVAAMLAGAAWGFVPGILKSLTGAHEVVTTIMLNTIAASIVGWLVTGPLDAHGFSFARTGDLGNSAIPVILGRNLHAGVALSIIAVPAIWFLLYRSTLGFQIRAVGANPSAARYAGMLPAVMITFTMSLAGLLAGLAGGIEILGITGFINASYGTNVGFDSITVALLGRTHPVGVLFAAILFGALRAGAGLMQITTGIPVEIVDVIQAIVLLFVAADVIVRNVFRIRATSGSIAELQTVTKSYSGGAVR